MQLLDRPLLLTRPARLWKEHARQLVGVGIELLARSATLNLGSTMSERRYLRTVFLDRPVRLSWIETDEHHAIWSTLHSMVWTDVAFKTLINFAVDDDENALNNQLLVEALLNGHVATQVLAIRRLMDRASSGTISLRIIKVALGCQWPL